MGEQWTPLDSQKVDDAFRMDPRKGLLLLVLILFTLMLACQASFAQNYDATPYRKLHATQGFYESGNVAPMVILYEGDLFKDRKNIEHHVGEMPDSDFFVKKLEGNEPVLIDIESYTSDHEYLAEVVRHIKAIGGVREYWWYGSVYTPRSRFEWPIEAALKSMDKWKDSPLKKEITGLAVPCYTRWNYREVNRSEVKKAFCDIAGIKTIGIVWTDFHNKNWELRERAKTISEVRDDVRANIAIWGRVALWAPPNSYESEDKKEDLANGRLVALEIMDK